MKCEINELFDDFIIVLFFIIMINDGFKFSLELFYECQHI